MHIINLLNLFYYEKCEIHLVTQVHSDLTSLSLYVFSQEKDQSYLKKTSLFKK
jgi:hypothetical protein